MGDDGLRQAKLSYKPDILLVKNSLTEKRPLADFEDTTRIKEETRQLWETVFCEDSKEFVDLYFSRVYHDNINITCQLSGHVAAALQAIPHSILLKGQDGFGASYLARMVGQKKAREIWFLCRQYSAREAEEMGMVNKVVPLAELEDTCVEWAEIMMERSPLALRMIKAGLNAELDGQAGIQELAGDATMLYYTMDEAQEGGKAFLEKRKPRFDDYPQFP